VDNDTILTVSSRFFEYLVFVLAYSSIIHGAVQGTFRFLHLKLADTWWDEAAIAVLSLFFAVGMDWNAMFYIANVTPDQYLGARAAWIQMQMPAASMPPYLVFLAGNVVTAAMVVIGRQGVVAIAEEFRKSLDAIRVRRDHKVQNGE